MRTQEFQTKTRQPVTMRVAGPTDRPAVERLAALDSKRAPQGDVLIAEVGGELRAAVPFEGGPAIADPFRLTGDLVALLRERAEQVTGAATSHRGTSFGFRLARAA